MTGGSVMRIKQWQISIWDAGVFSIHFPMLTQHHILTLKVFRDIYLDLLAARRSLIDNVFFHA
jgi:hypothetical protein